MFQLFLRPRAHRLLNGRRAESEFRARSAKRDAGTDRARVDAILNAIERALEGANAESNGLGQRVEDVLARAAVTLGNDTDEYMNREPLDSHHLDLFDAEIFNGQRRLKELNASIAHLRFLKTELLTRFPEVASATLAN